jgi:hypothetical protein
VLTTKRIQTSRLTALFSSRLINYLKEEIKVEKHRWGYGMLTMQKEYEFWLRLKTKEDAMNYIYKLDSFMERFISEVGKYSIIKRDVNDQEKLFTASAEMHMIIKKTNLSLNNFLFSKQQFERIIEYNNFATGQDYDISIESQNEEIEIRDFVAHAHYVNVNTVRLEDIMFKQKQKIQAYHQETRSLYREIDRLKQKIRELEGKEHSSDN